MDQDDRNYDRLSTNAGNIGFNASVDTGVNDIKVNMQCEQFTFVNNFVDFAGVAHWCNRNSKIGLAHPQADEIMFATWLLPYNEGIAQWIDPFYDAGADSHTSIMRTLVLRVKITTTLVLRELQAVISTVAKTVSSNTSRQAGMALCFGLHLLMEIRMKQRLAMIMRLIR